MRATEQRSSSRSAARRVHTRTSLRTSLPTRTPIRQALSRLVVDGRVTAQSPRSLVVTDMDVGGVRSLYELRQAPELLSDSEDGLRRYFEIVDALDAAIDEATAGQHDGVWQERPALRCTASRRRHEYGHLAGVHASHHDGATDRALDALMDSGHLRDKLEEKQDRADLYELIDYESYNRFDTSVFNFRVER